MSNNNKVPNFSRNTYRSCYVNFASHLLNSFNSNMLYPELACRWRDSDWFSFIDMIADFGFNVFEFWLVPKLFCREALASEAGNEFARQMQEIVAYAQSHSIKTKMLCSLATVGPQWHTYCPNINKEWQECLHLWNEWTKRLDGLGIIGIFPGDPGACSRNGCTAETFIDKAVEVAALVKHNLPNAEIELGTWGNPFFGWGCIEGPPEWKGEFIQSYQHTAWTFCKKRSDNAMNHLITRLNDFPKDTNIAINLAFNPDGDPQANDGIADARYWANEIAKTNPIVTWDFSLTEGENAVIPHYRFERLFQQRKRERDAAPYCGGICYTMTPLLNQLSLYMSAQSFINPDADYQQLVVEFYHRIFGQPGIELSKLVRLFEIVPDWGNHTMIEMSREDYHQSMKQGVELLHAAADTLKENLAFAPSVKQYRQTLLWYFNFFQKLSAPAPDFDALYQEYWMKVYAIYNQLPKHVDPRPKQATERIINSFNPTTNIAGPIAGKWVT